MAYTYEQQQPQYANQNNYPQPNYSSHDASTAVYGYPQQPLPPMMPQRQLAPMVNPSFNVQHEEHQYQDRPNSGRKYDQPAPYYVEQYPANPYPQHVDPNINKAVEGEKNWQKRT